MVYAFVHPGEHFYVRELATLIDEDPGNLSRELTRLRQEGIFTSYTKGREKFYSLNRAFPLYKELKAIVAKTEGVEALLKDIFSRVSRIKAAFIHGSYAQHKETADSDIDVILVGAYPDGALLNEIRRLEERLGREINFTSYSEDEFVKQRRIKGSFLSIVLRGKIIALKGTVNA